jgi:hypothetical protein
MQHQYKLSLSLILICLGSACVGTQSASEAPESDVKPLVTFDETSSAPEDSALPCEVSNLALSYVDDDSEARGRLRVSWQGARTGSADVEVEVQGSTAVKTTLDSLDDTLLSSARLQSARDVLDGEIEVNVRVQLACGAASENLFVFADPVKRCAAPTLESIPGHEAEFYACAERWVGDGQGCGAKGYLLGYGQRYAEKFYVQTRPRMSAKGKVWLDHVLVCLQTDLREAIDIDTSCDDIRRTAFDQHPHCYAESGFCTLPLRDVLQVPATIDGNDLFSRDGFRQLLGIIPECGKQYEAAASLLFH